MRAALLTLTRAPGLGNATIKKLLAKYSDAEAVVRARTSELQAFPRFKAAAAEFLNDSELAASAQQLQEWTQAGFRLIFWGESDYPDTLTRLSDPPMFLFHQGRLAALQKRSVAIVGTREPARSSANKAMMIAAELVDAGYAITSGFALGIDRAAHEGALKAGGSTIAVLGSGMRSPHPKSNHDLIPRIEKDGCIISEFYPSTPARGRTLMSRNRIVIALSEAVVVVEAGLKSGSIDAAQRALRLGVPVLAVAGSRGTDMLLKNGASIYENPASLRYQAPQSGPEQLELL